MRILIINGPNLNMLGVREQNIYGPMKLEQIHAQMKEFADKNSVEIEFFQSNLEGEIVDRIQECLGDADGIIINPAAFTHTSVALRDGLAAVSIPFIEVHLSNTHAREEFRQLSYFSDLAEGVICGLGAQGYELALLAAMNKLDQS